MTVEVIRSIYIGTGIFLLLLNFLFYVKKRIYEDLALIWVVASILEIIIGLLPAWDVKIGMFGIKVFIPLSAAISVFAVVLFFVSASMSVLNKKNQELAMQVSLLNQENEMMLKRVSKLEEKNEEKDTICN